MEICLVMAACVQGMWNGCLVAASFGWGVNLGSGLSLLFQSAVAKNGDPTLLAHATAKLLCAVLFPLGCIAGWM